MSGAEPIIAMTAAEAAAAATAAEIAAAAAAAEIAAAEIAASELALAAAAEGSTTAGMYEAAASSASAMEGAAASSSLMGTPSPFATSMYQQAVPGLTMTGPGSQAAMLAAQTGEFGFQGLASTAGSGGSPFFSALSGTSPISPNQAMALQRQMGGLSSQGGTQTQTGAFKPGQQVNLADPIASLLAPKRKKERPMISLL